MSKNKQNDTKQSKKNWSWDALIIPIITLIIISNEIFNDKWSLLKFDDFRITQQFYLPIAFGALGGYCYILMKTLDNTNAVKNHDHAKLKFAFLGSVAGFTAVNLLNPTGTVSQIIILSLIAGLSCISYLKRNALVDTKYEDLTFKKWEEDLKEALNEKKSLEEKIENENNFFNSQENDLGRAFQELSENPLTQIL